MVGEALMDEIVDDIGERELEMIIGVGASKRKVILNQRDAELGMVTANKVAGAPVKVALDEIPSTPAYRMQQQKQIAEVLQVGGQDPAVRAVLIPSFIEATDLPNREHDARLLRQMYGVPQPGDKMALDKRDQESQAGQQNAQNSQIMANQATAADKNADAMLNESTARLNVARADEINARTQVATQPVVTQPPTEDQLIQEILAEAAAPA